ncbi:MAG: amino acid ABC transporter substrate-binding protein [Acidimicrobiaceae bacterium]|nr:amino acid ABC transporter substrate-binding protein [Acidimicrobiaceae bacterium]
MQKSRVKRVGALLVGLSLIAAACGDDEDDEPVEDSTPEAEEPSEETTDTTEAMDEEPAEEPAEETTDTTEAMDEEPAEEGAATTVAGDGGEAAAGCDSDGVLTIGTILPVTGDLAFLGPPEIAGADLAVEDINAAGGVLGADVVLEQGDSGDTTTDTANLEVDRLLAAGSDAIVGAASSAVSKTVIDKITGSCTIQFSPANTSPDFTTYDDNGLFFRTAPSDLLQGRVLANVVLEDGAETASVLYRQESYGIGLAESFQENFTANGGVIDEFLAYAVDTESFDAEVDALVEADSDAIIVIGFAESASILTTMNERGIGPADKAVYGTDGNIGGIGAELADPSIIAGMRGTEPSVDLSTISDFIARLDEAGDMGGVYAYGAETYDAIIITALAAAVAGTDDPSAVAAEINGVTGGGEKCTTFADCIALIDAGTDIDYDGLGGPYEFVEAGEPAAASFRIATYDGEATPNNELDEFVFAS